MNITLQDFIGRITSHIGIIIKDSDGNTLLEDKDNEIDATMIHTMVLNIPDEYKSRKVDTFHIDINGRLTIQLEKPIETINFSTDVEYIRRSEKRMYDWLNIQGTIESSNNQKQKILTFLQSLDDNDQALVKFVCMVCTCDKNLLDGGDKNV